jgi:putative ubiquitin-RnfH superfamily antitoxin RatB of RatAB toxin-antitoxin module
MADDEALAIEVAYARADEQVIVQLSVSVGTTVAEAVERSMLRSRFAEIERAPAFGIYGKTVSGDTPVRAGDRVEIYRGLVTDPKQARRRRAAAKAPSR